MIKCRCCKLHVTETLREFGDVTTLHGVRYVTEPRAHLCERLCWTIAILTCAGLCAIEIHKLYSRWQEQPIIVTLKRSAHVTSIPFPAVTICPESRVFRRVINIEENFHWLTKYYEGKYKNISDTDRISADVLSFLCDKRNFKHTFLPSQEHRKKIFDMSPHYIPDTFEQCIFDRKPRQCSDIFHPILLESGICFTFNGLSEQDMFTDKFDRERSEVPKHEKMSKRSMWSLENGYINKTNEDETYPFRESRFLGPFSGLQLILKVNTDEIQTSCTEENAENFRIYIHSPIDYPFFQENYFHISPEMHAMVSVKPEFLQADESLRGYRYNPELRGCSFPEDHTIFAFKNMTEQNCMLHNYYNYSVTKCSCTPFLFPLKDENGSPIPYCETNNHNPVCSIPSDVWQCLPSCRELKYKYHISNSKYQRVTNTAENIKFTKLNIFNEGAKFFPIRKGELYGITDFIANCGGLLGLFTGFSLISAIEIIYFASLRVYCRVHEKRKLDQEMVRINRNNKNEGTLEDDKLSCDEYESIDRNGGTFHM